MFGKLSSLFGRNFAVGFFLPTFLFLFANCALFGAPTWLAKTESITNWTENDTLRTATVATFVAWLGGIVLVAFNRPIFRCFEGYGRFNPLRLLSGLARHRFRSKQSECSTLEAAYKSAAAKNNDKKLLKIEAKRAELMRYMAESYPDDVSWVLPTSFGNILRSFEVYSRVLYGAESITIWPRLVIIIPEKTRGLLDDAKANVDFWTNLLALTICFAIELAFYGMRDGKYAYWPLLGCGAVALLARSRKLSAAIEWGNIVKACFDIFLPQLFQALKLQRPRSREEEISIWTAFSQTAEYRLPEIMPTRDYTLFVTSDSKPPAVESAAEPVKSNKDPSEDGSPADGSESDVDDSDAE